MCVSEGLLHSGASDLSITVLQISAYLLKTFPLLHEKLNLTKINTHGLVYTWYGSDASLAPSLLQAHQDTVPVNGATIEDWTFP